jgi:hypothetical protein
MTQEDIINSKFIRNLIQLLVNTILERVFAQGNSNILQVNMYINICIYIIDIYTLYMYIYIYIYIYICIYLVQLLVNTILERVFAQGNSNILQVNILYFYNYC